MASSSLSLYETHVWSLRTTPANVAGSGNPTLALQQAKQLCQLHFRYTYGSPSTVPALLYALRVANRSLGPKDSLENRIQRAYGDLEMLSSYPSLVPLPPSVSNDTTKHKEKAYGRVLKYRVSEVWRRAVSMDGNPPQGRMAAFMNHTYDDLTRTCSPQHPICVAFRRIQHTTCFEFELRISSLRRNPDQMECSKHKHG